MCPPPQLAVGERVGGGDPDTPQLGRGAEVSRRDFDPPLPPAVCPPKAPSSPLSCTHNG